MPVANGVTNSPAPEFMKYFTSPTGSDWQRFNSDGTFEGGGSINPGAINQQSQPNYQPQQYNQQQQGGWPSTWGPAPQQGPAPMMQPNIAPPGGPMYQQQQPRSGGGGGGYYGGGQQGGIDPMAYQMVKYQPNSATYNRYQALLQNPNLMTSDPAYQFLVDQGTGAMGRSAGAKRMRFSGKNQLDYQDYGQRAASQYWDNTMNQLGQGAQMERSQYNDEYAHRLGEASGDIQMRQRQAQQADPYGNLRTIASRYGSADAYAKASNPTQMLPGYGSGGYDVQGQMQKWQRGHDLLKSLGMA